MSSWEEASGKSDEWYTPRWIFDALACRFDLDVAAPQVGPLHVPAARWYWQDSLSLPWEGFVWMNPPFGGRNGLEPWLVKFFEHGNGIALTPDRTSAKWFQKWASHAAVIRFLPKVKFIRPDGTVGNHPSCGTALWAVGERATQVLRAAGALGWLAEPVSTSSDDMGVLA